jgi:hypothetical protein
MKIDLQLLLILLIPVVFWVWGYFDTRYREVMLPNVLKYLFGKPGKPIHKAGFVIQSIGIIFVITYGMAFLETKTKLSLPISAFDFFVISGLIMILATLLDDRFLQWKNNSNNRSL